MLGKELLRTRTAGKYIRPQFIKTNDPALLDFASRLINIMTNGTGSTAETLDTCLNSITLAKPDPKLTCGLVKTLRSRGEFNSENNEINYKEERKLFLKSANHEKPKPSPNPRLVNHNLSSCETQTFKIKIIYPTARKRRPTRFRNTFPRELLERYNLSLVQSLLLYSRSMTCAIPTQNADPQEIRRIFKYLRFFRLLAKAEKNGNTITMTIDGPASILENSLKYGLQLASFFPALCKLPKWKISSEIQLRNRTLTLVLDEKSELVSHYMNISSYKPEELGMFADYFRKNVAGWQIDDCPDFLLLEGKRIIFPDYMFTNTATGEIKYLELFHKWHANETASRMDYIESHRELTLITGVDTALVKNDPSLKERIIKAGGFVFNNYPGAERVLKILEKS